MKELSFVQIMQKYYEKSKKHIAYSIVIILVILEVLSQLSLFKDDNPFRLALITTGIFIIMEMLFRIYEKIIADKALLEEIDSTDLYAQILNLVKSRKSITIQCIGVAGRHAWYSVLKKLLDSNSEYSLHELNKFNVEIALISKTFLEKDDNMFEKYDALGPIVNDIERTKESLEEDNKNINLYFYEHTPNFIGFLINDSYLFSNICFWEEKKNGTFDFRGAGTRSLLYHLNDEFGGSYYIKRFKGWFDHIKQNDINKKK